MTQENECDITSANIPAPTTPVAPVSEDIDAIDYGRAIKDYGPLSTPPETEPQQEK